MKVLSIAGARPQFIKAAVVSRAIASFNEGNGSRRRIEEKLVHTGQHYDDGMSGVFFRELDIPDPSYYLGVGSGPHGWQTGRMLEAIEQVMEQQRPDWVLVYGDTNSTLAGGLAASKLRIPVAHAEAGLRSYNRLMPEETNRVLVDHLSTLLFCPTTRAVKNLSCEGITTGVHLVGDLMYDSLLHNLVRDGEGTKVLDKLGLTPCEYGLATIHRAESTDDEETTERLITTLDRLEFPIVLPLHPRTRKVLQGIGVGCALHHVRLIDPVSYCEMLALERHARMILTDSGGVQKEAFLLRVPCITLRNETEWVETVEAGWNRLAGTNPEQVVSAVADALQGKPLDPGCPYGDGHAAERILEILAGDCLYRHV